MSHTVQVPDDIYARLAAVARQRGKTPEELLLEWAADVAEQAERQTIPAEPEIGPDHDPIAPFIGAFTFGVGDLAEQHDTYLAEAYADDEHHEQ